MYSSLKSLNRSVPDEFYYGYSLTLYRFLGSTDEQVVQPEIDIFT